MGLWTKDYVGYNRVEAFEKEVANRINLGGAVSDSPRLESK